MEKSRLFSSEVALAGAYSVICYSLALVLLTPLGDMAVELMSLPTGSRFVLSLPTFFIGGTVWWAVIERSVSYTYVRGATFGVLTAFLTVTLWLLRLLAVWELSLILEGGLVVAFVFGLSVPVGLFTGLTFTYAYRCLGGPTEVE